jgi:hypothetical protein
MDKAILDRFSCSTNRAIDFVLSPYDNSVRMLIDFKGVNGEVVTMQARLEGIIEAGNYKPIERFQVREDLMEARS